MAYDASYRSDADVLKDFLVDAGFSRDVYLRFNPDLAHFDDNGLIGHMLEAGLSEHRRLPIVDPFASAASLLHLDPERVCSRLLARALASEMTVYQRDRFGAELSAQEIAIATSLRALGIRTILVVGDSHSEAYAQPIIAREGILPLWMRCPGASAKGLANSHSQGGYSGAIRRFLDMAPGLPALFQFGQVDLEFCHVYRCLMEDRREAFSEPTFSEEMADAVAAYSSFLNSLEREILVAGVFPSTLADNEFRTAFARAQIGFLQAYPGDLRADLDKIAIPTELERNRLHRDLNAQLTRMGFPMVLPSPAIVGDDGRVAANLRGEADHHLCFETASYYSRDSLLAALS